MDADKEKQHRWFITVLLKTSTRIAILLFFVCIAGKTLAEAAKETPLSDEPVVEVVVESSPAKLPASPGVNSSDWLKAILGLISVVVLIFAIAWFVKRFTGLAVSNQQQMRIISAIPVGAKERIALIEVADKQVLVGITQHNINLLHSFEEPVVNNNDKTTVDFSSRLQAILSKGPSD
ncbi:flagellar biosynthetic protein FliO [Alkalimarinus alittae]|uniref:Flagellar protein n=1 Tax=Alkalimarinus alittae TaxID=2961619 RepID=A0ABY6MYM3_9ALTE|nr:flagellar biosynthetic protein FliO [Alkalimarinus alittae]UZE94946.1 flagellar biosynthetic protein FliO [Alkalimarinus alittae]